MTPQCSNPNLPYEVSEDVRMIYSHLKVSSTRPSTFRSSFIVRNGTEMYIVISGCMTSHGEAPIEKLSISRGRLLRQASITVVVQFLSCGFRILNGHGYGAIKVVAGGLGIIFSAGTYIARSVSTQRTLQGRINSSPQLSFSRSPSDVL